MKALIVLIAALITQNQALAGNTECRNNINLACNLKANYADGTSKNVTSAVSMVSDTQPEPFDPARCEVTVALSTELGKFFAYYSDDSRTLRSWLERAQAKIDIFVREQSFATGDAFTTTVPAGAGASYPSMTFSCTLEDNN